MMLKDHGLHLLKYKNENRGGLTKPYEVGLGPTWQRFELQGKQVQEMQAIIPTALIHLLSRSCPVSSIGL
jgi:hypothetical protein